MRLVKKTSKPFREIVEEKLKDQLMKNLLNLIKKKKRKTER